MKKIYKKEEGVSPVIATILMVAITVVLAATVWLLVSGYMGGTNQPQLTASLTYNVDKSNVDSKIVVFTISMSAPSSVDYTKVTVTVNGTKITNENGSASIPSAAWAKSQTDLYWGYVDLDGNGALSSGDWIWIAGGSVGSGATIAISVSGYTGSTTATVPS